MAFAQSHHIEREYTGADKWRPATPMAGIELDPSPLTAVLERRIAELSERLHALTTERSILADELRLLRAGRTSAAEITITLATRRISM